MAELLAHHVVELPHAREAGGERDVGQRQAGLVHEQPGGLRPTGAREGERPDADLGDQHAVKVPLADREPFGQSDNADLVDGTGGDQSQRAGGEVGAVVPFA